MKDQENKGGKIIEVFSGTVWEAGLMKSLFENAEIKSFLKNNVLNTYAYEPITSEGVKVMIFNTDRERALEIVATYFKNKKINN